MIIAFLFYLHFAHTPVFVGNTVGNIINQSYMYKTASLCYRNSKNYKQIKLV